MAEPKVAIVTGASSGIGLETAAALARHGYAVVLAARRKDRLELAAQRCRSEARPRGDTDHARIKAVVTDVASREQVDDLVAAALADFGRVDVMVNNAGYGMFDRVHEIDAQGLRRLFDVNFFGTFHGCQAVAPVMIRQRSGHIFNISSVIGRRGTPFRGGYCATKFAIRGLSDAMRVEMKPYNVLVTCVCPGRTQTDFAEDSHDGRLPWRSGIEGRIRRMPPAIVARKIAASAEKNIPELVFTFGGKLLVLLNFLAPRLVDYVMGLHYRDLVRQMKKNQTRH